MRQRALTAVVVAWLLPAAAPAQTLSRSEAVALAVANNPEVRKSQQALLSLRGQGREALADALPEVNVYGIGTRYRDPSLLNRMFSRDSGPNGGRASSRSVSNSD